jgi:hypothetical protein
VSSPIRILLCSGSDCEVSAQLASHAIKKLGWTRLDWATPQHENDESAMFLALLEATGAQAHAAGSAQAWSVTSVAKSLDRALLIWSALDQDSSFVIDCGEVSQFLDDVNDVRALREIAQQAMRPELLMDVAGRQLHAQLSAAIQAVDGLFETLGTQAVLRLAVRPGSYPSGEISEIALDCAVQGIVLDCVVVAPAEKKIGKSEARRLLSEFSRSSSDIHVVHAREMKAGPKGQQVQQRCTEGVAIESVREIAGVNRGQYIGEVLASGLDSAELRVGVLDENLVLATPRVRRVLPLPSTLVRCAPIDAGVDATGVHIHFSVEPSLWPESLAAQTGLSAGDRDD